MRWPGWTGGTADWRAALAETREEWRAAYLGEPSSSGAAVSLLAEAARDEERGPSLVA